MQHGHITSVRTYLIVFAALMVFTVLTVVVAFLNLGPWNDVVALTIAIIKAALIILFFMHVRYSDSFTKVVVVAGWLWLVLLIIGVFSDVVTRGWRFPSL